ncbi:unnamed protein product [Rhizoctonia solani]|uniref:F-box domain-containing protein n=1 Tax=Rhizoctonia solani TaxID=456999 RepID=A0A8H3DJC2_9AGAM|nr:unnamed protein product [Rhizoctonia solani]
MAQITRYELTSLWNPNPNIAMGGTKIDIGPGSSMSPNLRPNKIARYEVLAELDPPSISPLVKVFTDLPLDILVEISTYLRPLDLIRISRVNKMLRGLLMRRSAKCIWRATLHAANALPPNSTNLPEPLITALLFLAECTICGEYTDEVIDFVLQAKLCLDCRKTRTISVTDNDCTKLISMSNPQGASLKSGNVCLREDYERIKSKRAALQATGDTRALKRWTKERIEAVKDRSKVEFHSPSHAFNLTRSRVQNARLLAKWFKTWVGKKRVKQGLPRKERRKLTNALVADIETRMNQMGYMRSEMRQLKYSEHKKWRKWIVNLELLDDQGKLYSIRRIPAHLPIENAAWELLLPHLLHHLERNRTSLRRSQRQPTLNSILSRIRSRLKPISYIRPQFDVKEWVSLSVPASSSSTSESADDYESSLDNNMILPSFPHNNDILFLCPEVQAIVEAQTPRETFELEIQTMDSPMEYASRAWRDVLELTLLNLLPEGTQPVETGTSGYKVILGSGQDARSLDLLSVECRKLLRADATFCIGKPHPSCMSKRLLYYPEAFQGQFKISDRENLHYDTAAAKIARALLCAMGLPDISYFAMDAVPRIYQCGRCDSTPIFCHWKELLQHYLQKAYANQMVVPDWNSRSPKATDPCILMHDVDSVYPDKPLVQLVDVPAYVPDFATTSSQGYFLCLICLQADIPAENYLRGDDVQFHFQNIHQDNEPFEGIHYVLAPAPRLLFS